MPPTASPALEEPILKAPSRSARGPAPFSVVTVTLVLSLIILFTMDWWLDRPSTASARVLERSVSPPWSLPTPTTLVRPTGTYQGLCDGSELFCLSAESGQPAETLRQLVAVLTVKPAQRYQIHLSITPLEEEPPPASEAPVPASPPAAVVP